MSIITWHINWLYHFCDKSFWKKARKRKNFFSPFFFSQLESIVHNRRESIGTISDRCNNFNLGLHMSHSGRTRSRRQIGGQAVKGHDLFPDAHFLQSQSKCSTIFKSSSTTRNQMLKHISPRGAFFNSHFISQLLVGKNDCIIYKSIKIS